MVLEIKVVFMLKGGFMTRASGVLEVPIFKKFVSSMCSLCENLLGCILKVCAFFCVYVIFQLKFY